GDLDRAAYKQAFACRQILSIAACRQQQHYEQIKYYAFTDPNHITKAIRELIGCPVHFFILFLIIRTRLLIALAEYLFEFIVLQCNDEAHPSLYRISLYDALRFITAVYPHLIPAIGRQ